MFFTDSQLQEAINEFKDEGIELLNGMETALLEIQENGMDAEHINAVFRAAHTIKGSAGMLKLDHLVEFTHIAENLLDDTRNNKIPVSEAMIGSLLQCKDHMQNLVLFYASHIGKTPDDSLQTISHFLMDELKRYSPKYAQAPVKEEKAKAPSKTSQEWTIDVTFGKNLLTEGMDPSNFIRFLSSLGEVKSMTTDFDAIEKFSRFNPTQCYIACHVELISQATQQEIEDVFEFIKDDITLQMTQRNVDENEDDGHEEIYQEEIQVKNRSSDKIISGNGSSDEHANAITSSTLRVDSEKIDLLINLIGEMVIANANVVQKSSDLNNDELIESVSIVSHMLEEVRENAMKIRMVQIGETFNRFKRIVHDVSKKLDKEVELIINGGETEMDKTIVEKISDPLIHIVRNAMDHGIENMDDRLLAGKKPKGRLELNAFHDAGTISIQVIDDGKGIDEEIIFAKAVEKGLIDADAKLSQKEIFALLFEAGFSTAEQITDLSGRGVGMDVVRRNIQSLRGTVDVASTKGKGSTVTIRLPLTLAIIDGFLIRVGKTHYVIPLDMVLECMELPENHQEQMSGNEYINLRGNILPLLNLRNFFDEKAERSYDNRDNVVVVKSGDHTFGLIVEELLGEFQTVIKPLGKIFRGLKGISGSTILGSGELALIIDVPILLHTIGELKTIAPKGMGKQ